MQGDGKLEQFTPNLCTLKVRVRSPELTPYERRGVGYTFKTSVGTKNFLQSSDYVAKRDQTRADDYHFIFGPCADAKERCHIPFPTLPIHT